MHHEPINQVEQMVREGQLTAEQILAYNILAQAGRGEPLSPEVIAAARAKVAGLVLPPEIQDYARKLGK